MEVVDLARLFLDSKPRLRHASYKVTHLTLACLCYSGKDDCLEAACSAHLAACLEEQSAVWPLTAKENIQCVEVIMPCIGATDPVVEVMPLSGGSDTVLTVSNRVIDRRSVRLQILAVNVLHQSLITKRSAPDSESSHSRKRARFSAQNTTTSDQTQDANPS